MLQKLEIRGIHVDIDDNLRRYITKKIGRLDRYLSRHDRESIKVEIHLKESKTKDKKNAIAEATVHLPHDTIVVKESTLNMFAAIDIIEQKLRHQLQKHKDLRENGKTKRKLFSRFAKRNPAFQTVPISDLE